MDANSDIVSPESMTPPLRATAIVGFGSLATLALSVVTAKAYAILIGPEGLGLLALMLGLVNVVMVVSWMGIPTSVIRWIAARQADPSGSSSVRASALVLGLVAGGAAAVLLLLARDLVAILLGSPDRAGDVVFLAFAVMAGTVAGIQIGILNGQHRVGSVTGVHVGTATAATSVGIGLVATFGESGLAPAFLATFAVQAILSHLFIRPLARPLIPKRMREIATGLIREGAPIAASQLAAAGVLLAVPLVILRTLGPDDVGQYRAATAISTGYLSFFLAALTQDFLPRISKARSRDDAVELVERRMRLVMGLGVPIILGLLAIGPWLVDVLYTEEFSRSFEMLQWQLVGDLIRLPAWVLAFVLIARERSAAYFGYELSVGVLLVGTTYAGIGIAGLPGAGVAYAATQFVMYVAVWWIVRKQLEASPGRLQVVVVIAALLSAGILLAIHESVVRLVLFAVAAVVLAVAAWPRLYRLHQAGGL